MSQSYQYEPDALAVTAGAYSASDVVGGLLRIPISPVNAGGTLRWLRLVDDANQKAAMSLYLFNDLPSTIADNAAFAPSVADLEKMVAKIAIAAGDYETLNSNAIAILPTIIKTVPIEKGALWAYLVTSGTPTYAATTDLSLSICVWPF